MTIDNDKAITGRRKLLKTGVLALGTLPFITLMNGPAQAKVAQTAVAYQPEPKDGRSCANCSLFEAPGTCKTVDGAVSPDGWCKIWVKKPA